MEHIRPDMKNGGEIELMAPKPYFRIVSAYLDKAQSESVTERDRSIVRRMADFDSTLPLNLAGSIALDIAARPDLTTEEQLDWMVYASDLWQRSVEQADGSINDQLIALNSETNLVCMPSHFDLIYDGRIPNQKIQRTMYEKLTDIAIRTVTVQETAKIINPGVGVDAIGSSAELATLLLHQRFVTNKLGEDSQMLALPSHFSEDRSVGRRRQAIKNAWDVSIYTKYPKDETPVLAYKVQVKSSKNAAQLGNSYADDIVQLNVYDQLIVTNTEKKYGRVLIRSIPNECSAELKGKANYGITKILDARTDKLLEILG